MAIYSGCSWSFWINLSKSKILLQEKTVFLGNEGADSPEKRHLCLLFLQNLHQGGDPMDCQVEFFNFSLQRCRDPSVPLLRAGSLHEGPSCCSPWHTMPNFQGPFASKGEVNLASKPHWMISTFRYLEKRLIIHLLHYGEVQPDIHINRNDALTLQWYPP